MLFHQEKYLFHDPDPVIFFFKNFDKRSWSNFTRDFGNKVVCKSPVKHGLLLCSSFSEQEADPTVRTCLASTLKQVVSTASCVQQTAAVNKEAQRRQSQFCVKVANESRTLK